MHVPDDYDRDRRNQTWREVHGWSEKARKRRADLRKKRRRNREPGRFGKVNWEAYQHDQLFDMIHRANVGEMASRANQWNSLAAKIEATTADVQRVMERVMGAWHGQAAVSSAASSSRLMQWAGTASQTAGLIAQGMSSYAEAVDRAQARMPEPGFATAERNFRDGYTVVGTGGPSTAVLLKELLSDGLVSHEEARSRKAEAVQVMEAYESQSKDVHDTMPHFSDATPTTNQGVDDGATGTPWQDDPAPNHNPPQTTPGTPSPSGAVPGNASTSASSFADPSLGGGRGTAGGAPGTFGGPGGGLGSLGSGGSDVIRNSPGFGGAGGLAGVGPVPGRGPGGAGGVLGGARGAGGAGAFGGMPVGHGAQGEEDKEHRNKYDQGMDFFDDLPPAYPSVFGA